MSRPEKDAKYLGAQWSLRPASLSRRSSLLTPLRRGQSSAVSVRRSRLHQLAEDGNPLAAGWYQSSNPLRRSIATLPRARSVSPFRVSFSAPTRKRRLLSGWPRTRRTGWTSGGCRRVDVHHRRAAGTHGGTSGLCGARAQIGGPSISDADGPLHPHPNGRLAVGFIARSSHG